jgi:hypothetical protein
MLPELWLHMQELTLVMSRTSIHVHRTQQNSYYVWRRKVCWLRWYNTQQGCHKSLGWVKLIHISLLAAGALGRDALSRARASGDIKLSPYSAPTGLLCAFV